MPDKSFRFIVSDGPNVPKDPALRTLIRKHAMKDVGYARRKRGGYGRVNLRQQPPEACQAKGGPGHSSHSSTSYDSSATSSSTSTPPTDETEPDVLSPEDGQLVLADQSTDAWLSDLDGFDWLLPLNKNPATDYERMRMKYDFDIRDLSILTSFNIGKTTMLAMSGNPELLSTLFGSEMQSYLHFIPSRYGHKPYLTAVIDCVSAKAHSRLYPANFGFDATVMRMYAKALAALQDAVAGTESSLDSDLLCAIQMLSLHEMLDPKRADAYTYHLNGSALVVQRRTPSRFKSEYEKMLFHAHIGPTFTEALYEQKHCYLEQPEWMRLYESLVEETPWLTDRSPVIIHTRMQMLPLCSILPDTAEAMNPDKYDGGLLMTLELKARQHHKKLLQCLEDYKSHVVRMSMSNAPASELALRREVFGTALECLCVYKRILGALCEAERLQLETETQALAVLILDLQNQPAPRHSWLYSTHEKGVAAAVQVTREIWERDDSDATPREKRLAACARWHEFNQFLHG